MGGGHSFENKEIQPLRLNLTSHNGGGERRREPNLCRVPVHHSSREVVQHRQAVNVYATHFLEVSFHHHENNGVTSMEAESMPEH